MLGASLSALLCGEGRGGEGEGERERSDFTFLPLFLCVQVQGNTCLHFTPGKRTRGPEKERKNKEEEKGKNRVG